MKTKYKPIPKSRAKTAFGLLRDVRRVIQEEPKRLDMALVAIRGKAIDEHNRTPTFYRNHLTKPECGSVGCIAGWALMLEGKVGKNANLRNGGLTKAANLLGINDNQADKLFQPSNLVRATNHQTNAHATATIKHLDRFIKEHETQLRSKKLK